MNDYQRGIHFGLQLAVEKHLELAKSMAHFVTVEEWKGYKRGVEEYRDKLKVLRDE